MGAEQEYFLGTGGVFNLYRALTGEALPGKLDAIAQRNPLGKGMRHRANEWLRSFAGEQFGTCLLHAAGASCQTPPSGVAGW